MAAPGSGPARISARNSFSARSPRWRRCMRRSPAAVASAIGNHVDAIVLTLPTVVPPITQGLLRGIGLASAARNSAVPNVPTYGEMGFPNVYSGSWVGFFAPAKTPDAIVAKLNAEINAIMREPQAQEKLKTIGFEVMIKTVGEATDYFRSEVATWGKMT